MCPEDNRNKSPFRFFPADTDKARLIAIPDNGKHFDTFGKPFLNWAYNQLYSRIRNRILCTADIASIATTKTRPVYSLINVFVYKYWLKRKKLCFFTCIFDRSRISSLYPYGTPHLRYTIRRLFFFPLKFLINMITNMISNLKFKFFLQHSVLFQ